MRVVVTGASGAVGRHVADRLAAHPVVTEVVGLDLVPSEGVHRFDLLDGDLADVLETGDTIVHLAASPPGFASEQAAARNDQTIAERVFAAADDAGVVHVVLASSAMVYGAWPENPMPITEAAPVRPNPEFRFGVVRAEIEQRAEKWAAETGRDLTILRASTITARGRENALANLLRHSAAIRSAEGEAPMQFLHAEDFASAIELVVIGGHAGIFNVAADGWIRPTELVALRGTPDTPLRLPGFLLTLVSEGRRRMGATTHPGLTPYLQHSWVIANDRLRALGWQPEFTNEEAYVVGHDPGRLDGMTSKRRQEIALGVAGAAVAGSAVGLASLVSWLLRRRR